MKISKLAVYTALTCCAAFKPCTAQILVFGDGSFANGSTSSATFKVRSVSETEQPFASSADLFSNESEPSAQAPVATGSTAPIVNEAPSITNPFESYSTANDQQSAGQRASSDDTGAQGQPVGRHHRGQAGQKSMVDTILQYGAYQDIPNASYMPVQWPYMNGPSNSTNPIGQYMLRNWCVGGLWSSYPAERAAQCQAMQSHFNGCSHNHCNRYLNSGCQHGCSAGVGSACRHGSRCGRATCDICSGAAAPEIPLPPPPPAVPEEQVQVAPVSVQVPTLSAPIDPQPGRQ